MSLEQLERVNAVIRERPHFSLPMSVRRAGWEKLSGLFDIPSDVAFTLIDSGGVPGLLVAPPCADADRIVLYIHGGGFVLGSSKTYREFTSRLGRMAQARCVVIDYRLAPEHPFPLGLPGLLRGLRFTPGPRS